MCLGGRGVLKITIFSMVALIHIYNRYIWIETYVLRFVDHCNISVVRSTYSSRKWCLHLTWEESRRGSNRYLCNHHSAKWPPGVQSADNGCQTPPCPRFKSLAGSEWCKRSLIPKCCGHPSPSVGLRQNWWVGPLPGSWPALRPKSLPYFVAQCLGQGPNK